MKKYDKDEIKNSLTLQQVYDFVAELGGDPRYDATQSGCFVSRTICHNPAGEGSHKLYYYDNTHLFRCYTQCGDSFDIFELVRKATAQTGDEISLSRAIRVVAAYFGIAAADEENFDEVQEKLRDWEILKNYKQNSEFIVNKKVVEFREINEDILKFLPRPRIEPWIKEGISQEIMNERGICYDPVGQSIIIPHYADDGRLIGIRARTLIKEEEVYGKYRPAVLNGTMYNHPLGFALYNLNNAKEAIRNMGVAIVFESEKSCLKYASYFGLDNDISVAVCGSNLIQYQVELLLKYGAKEIVIALDRQYKEIGDAEYKQWIKKLKTLSEKYRKYAKISFMFDKEHLLDYKSSPIDHQADTFLYLFKNRLNADGYKF